MDNINNLLNASRETICLLEKYQSLILEWNKKINLVSRNITNQLLTEHVTDCLQLMKFIKNDESHIVDIGSGAGLPGIILSIAGIKNVTLVESNTKKAAFLLQASQISDNKVDIINERVEDIYIECDIIVSRAFANLNTIFNCLKHIRVKEKYLLLKGSKYKEELLEAQKYWSFDCIIHDSVISNTSKILEISNLVRTQ